MINQEEVKKSKTRLISDYRARCKTRLISSKSDQSRKKIIAAARKVFSDHSYPVATVRMVGAAGGFDHLAMCK